MKNISKSHALVNEFGEGDVYEYMNSGEHKYPCVFLTMSTVLTDTTSTNYNFTLFYIDRLTDDSDNKVNVQSMGISIIKEIVSKLISEEPVLETSSIECTPFTEKFADYCGGAFATITVTDIVDNTETESDECSENNFEGKTITLTKNGLYDIIGYDKAVVSIPLTGIGIVSNGEFINENGGWDRVYVDVRSVTTMELTQDDYDNLESYDDYIIYLINE